MKKEYKKPIAEIIEFVPEDDIMAEGLDPDDDVIWGSGVDDDFS